MGVRCGLFRLCQAQTRHVHVTPKGLIVLSAVKVFYSLIFAVSPWPIKRLLGRLRGWSLDPSAWIGISYFDCDEVTVGAGVRIGHMNVFRRVRSLTVEDGASIQNRNVISGAVHEDWPRTLIVGPNAR